MVTNLLLKRLMHFALLLGSFCAISHASPKSIDIVSEGGWPGNRAKKVYEGSLTAQISMLVLEHMGYEVNLTFHPWARAKRMTIDGLADGVAGIYFTDQRAELLTFTDPVITTEQVLFKRRDSDIRFDGDLSTLKGYSIGIVRNYTYGDVFDQAGQLNKVASTTPNNNLKMLLSGRVDLIIGSSKAIESLIAQNFPQQVDDIISLRPIIYEQHVHFAFSKTLTNHVQLTKQFNHVLLQLRSDGSIQRLEERFKVRAAN